MYVADSKQLAKGQNPIEATLVRKFTQQSLTEEEQQK